jgi:hypothetical protein
VSLPLVDVRFKVHPDTHTTLVVLARQRGVDLGELARQILDDWAGDRVHSARLLLDAIDREERVRERQGVTPKPAHFA